MSASANPLKLQLVYTVIIAVIWQSNSMLKQFYYLIPEFLNTQNISSEGLVICGVLRILEGGSAQITGAQRGPGLKFFCGPP